MFRNTHETIPPRACRPSPSPDLLILALVVTDLARRLTEEGCAVIDASSSVDSCTHVVGELRIIDGSHLRIGVLLDALFCVPGPFEATIWSRVIF